MRQNETQMFEIHFVGSGSRWKNIIKSKLFRCDVHMMGREHCLCSIEGSICISCHRSIKISNYTFSYGTESGSCLLFGRCCCWFPRKWKKKSRAITCAKNAFSQQCLCSLPHHPLGLSPFLALLLLRLPRSLLRVVNDPRKVAISVHRAHTEYLTGSYRLLWQFSAAIKWQFVFGCTFCCQHTSQQEKQPSPRGTGGKGLRSKWSNK